MKTLDGGHYFAGRAAAALILSLALSPTSAQEPLNSTRATSSHLNLTAGKASLEVVAAPFDTVIVGDPEVVSTSVVSATRLVLTALATGQTNIILLDSEGVVQTRWDIVVSEEYQHRATIYRGVTSTVVTCDPNCRSIRDFESADP